TCTNYNGNYSCSCPDGYNGDGYDCKANNSAESWDFGVECVKANGSSVCSDPCSSHTVLDNYWRSTSYGSGSNCDSDKRGWYRFVGSGGERMPETCVPINRCNTHAPIWLDGSHPSQDDSIVTRISCAHWDGNCCRWSSNVQVKACVGGYYVYKLEGTPECSLTYCTDPAYIGDPCSCNADEVCKLVNGTWGCQCTQELNSFDISNLQPELDCGTDHIKISISKCQLETMGFQNIIMHLTDNGCFGFEERRNRTLVSVVTPTQAGQCGTQLTKNETHATYSNTLYVADGMVIRENEININFNCSYPLEMKVSLETAIQPIVSSLNISLGGTGKFTIRMALYQDLNYTSPYEESRVVLSTDAMLYVGVMLDDGDTSQFVVVMKNCYATPTENAMDPLKYFIIQNSCSNPRDSTVTVSENGVSAHGQFALQVFKFVGSHNLVYLHCEIHLCDVHAEACKPSCSGIRNRRAAAIETDYVLNLGPIVHRGKRFFAVYNSAEMGS
uniref:Uromodulin n=1 Tax=Sphenodon punctatus TaxID=8508 RepID=A0A8D0GEM8_SPHPU